MSGEKSLIGRKIGDVIYFVQIYIYSYRMRRTRECGALLLVLLLLADVLV